MTDFQRVKEAIDLKEYANISLEKTKTGFICPDCGSGTKGEKTGGLIIKEDFWRCFACDKKGDIFDLIGLIHNTDNKRKQLEIAAQYAGINLADKLDTVQPRPKRKEEVRDYIKGRKEEAVLIRQAQETLKELSEEAEVIKYLASRGINKEQAIKLKLGYNAQTKRLVIPVKGTDYYHIDRDITNKQPNKYSKPKSDKVGEQPIWNLEAITQPDGQPLVIVEGAIDALAVELAGFNACALLSTKHDPTTQALLKQAKNIGLICLALDADEQGKKSGAELKGILETEGVKVCVIDFKKKDGVKDAGDILAKGDISALTTFLSDEIEKYEQTLKTREEAANRANLETLNLVSAKDIAFKVQSGDNLIDPIPTGIRKLDEYIGGGLQNGFLYVIGAISSLGKTTLAIQIADHIAAGGHSVLFATIEQSAVEIVSKSFSRMLYESLKLKIRANAFTNRYYRSKWNKDTEKKVIDIAEKYYNTIAPNLHLLESLERPKVENIETAARTIQQAEGQMPVVFIDYLQLLAALDDRDTDKQAVDKNITALRILARTLKTPIFAISSINRDAYSGAISLASFKESGAIEYGADILLGMQPEGITEEIESKGKDAKKAGNQFTEESKKKNIRDIEVSILKNRHGEITGSKSPIKLTYNAVANHFKEKTNTLYIHP